jgi:hypothetical protein
MILYITTFLLIERYKYYTPRIDNDGKLWIKKSEIYGDLPYKKGTVVSSSVPKWGAI